MPQKDLPKTPPKKAPLKKGGAKKEAGKKAPQNERLLHELSVHRAELEMQNEELRRIQRELEESRDRFRDLYDFAPVGYLTLDELGNITAANITLSTMLDVERSKLLGKPFSKYVTPLSQDAFYLNQRAALGSSLTHRCELVLRRSDATTFPVSMDSVGSTDRVTGELGMRCVLSDITERKQAEERLSASLREKEILLREVHHRVKNNLQVVSSLVSLQTESLADPVVRRLFADVRDRVRSMALVHERLYSSNSLETIDFSEYTRSLFDSLLRAHAETAANVRLVLAVQPLALPAGPAVHCGLILNELFSNTMKHAFLNHQGGKILVELKHNPQSGEIWLRVQDDGIGLPAEFDWLEAPSLGLRLVQMLAKQLHGTIELLSGPGTGFCVKFALNGATLTACKKPLLSS